MKFVPTLIVVSFIVLFVSFWNRNELPGRIAFAPRIDAEPLQTRTGKQPFDVEYNGVTYRVEPEYEYDITGMIVSYRHHNDENSRMHRLANDHINMLDVCVIWGNNAHHPRLDKIEFWNGIFTCNVKTRDQAAWDLFDMNKLSNNHLISGDDFIRRQVRKIRVGDQIRVKGYLAGYSSPGVGKRGTSATRTDTGNGACEMIFVEQFRILESAISPWRISMWLSLALLIAGLALHFRRPYRPY